MRTIGFTPRALALAAVVTTTAAAPSFTPGALPAVNVPEAVADHRVDNLSVAQAVSFARLRKKIRRVGHGLHPSGYNYCAIPRLYRLRCEADCFQSGAANFVYSHGTHFRRQSAVNRRLPRWILAESRGDDVAHDAFIYTRRLDSGALHGFTYYDCAELSSAEIR